MIVQFGFGWAINYKDNNNSDEILVCPHKAIIEDIKIRDDHIKILLQHLMEIVYLWKQ